MSRILLVTALALGLSATALGQAAVERDPLAQTSSVRGAKDRTLALSRVTVPPGAQLALHRHTGTQIARIEQGTLTYTVETGSVTVRMGDSELHPGFIRTIRAGQTGKIRPHQWIVEQPDDIHRAANEGSKPVVIYLATLLPEGDPPSVPAR